MIAKHFVMDISITFSRQGCRAEPPVEKFQRSGCRTIGKETASHDRKVTP
jgi:hypothetical protein